MKATISGTNYEGTPIEIAEFIRLQDNGGITTQARLPRENDLEPTTHATYSAWKAKRKHTQHKEFAGTLRHFNNWGKCAYYRKNAAGEWVFAAACNKLGHSHKHNKIAKHKASVNGVGVNGKNGIDLRCVSDKIRMRIKQTNNDKYGKVLHGTDGKGHCKLTRTIKGTHTKVYIGMCPTHKKR